MDIAVSTISLVDICIRYGTVLIQVCKSLKNADREIRETILKIEAHSLKVQHQLEFLRKIWQYLEEDYQIHQNTVLQVLLGKIMAATTLVDSVIGKPENEPSAKQIMLKKGDVRKAKYALRIKSSLDDVFADLKDWSEIFDMSWFLITLQPATAIDHELNPVEAGDGTSLSTLKGLRQAINSTINSQSEAEKTPVFLSPDWFDGSSVKLEYSSVELRRGVDGSSTYIVDHPNESSTLANVCNLANRLKNVEPIQYGIFKCHGVLRFSPRAGETENPSFTRFVFLLPSGLKEPQSLRKLLVSKAHIQSLDERFLIARQIAKAVMVVHSAGFVHKNIRPEMILVPEDDHHEPHAVLAGFKNFRLDQGRTLLHGDDLWEANLYRHPTRQGAQPEESYLMQHDIYSLGVCLLEIGLAESLVHYDLHETPLASPLLASVMDASIKDTRKKAFETKRGLVRIAEDKLPARMGRKYTEIVLTCLTCLDQSHNAFGSEAEFLDENGLLVGVRFIEKILMALLNLTL